MTHMSETHAVVGIGSAKRDAPNSALSTLTLKHNLGFKEDEDVWRQAQWHELYRTGPSFPTPIIGVV